MTRSNFFDNSISNVDGTLWSVLTLLTRSISERRGTARVVDPTSHSYLIKRIRRFYCLCCLMFCTDNRCSLPLHNLVTDTIESHGGSAMLVKLLNRLGACASTDTLARSIQHYVSKRNTRGPERDCKPTTLTIISADNIDFMHSYAKVFCGNQVSSWHGTTVQAVQPIPSLCEECPTTPVSGSMTTQHNNVDMCLHASTSAHNHSCGTASDPTVASVQTQADRHLSFQTPQRKRQANMRSPCFSPST